MNEKKPGLIDQKITFEKPFTAEKNPVFLSKGVQLGSSYTIRDLLTYMIKYSDNNATLLLNQHIDLPTFKKVFTDLELEAPDWYHNDTDYSITAKDYSLFLKELFNATYLNTEDSEYCMALLSECDFKDGLVAGLPPNCVIAHKFGEGGTHFTQELSESGIIYINNSVYLLTVMTKGQDIKKLPKAISGISTLVYEKISALTISRI